MLDQIRSSSEGTSQAIVWRMVLPRGFEPRPLPYQGSALPLSYGSDGRCFLDFAARVNRHFGSSRRILHCNVSRSHRHRAPKPARPSSRCHETLFFSDRTPSPRPVAQGPDAGSQRPARLFRICDDRALDRGRELFYKARAFAGRLTRPSRVAGAQVAQLVEHATENRSVGGSTPSLGTISPSHSFS